MTTMKSANIATKVKGPTVRPNGTAQAKAKRRDTDRQRREAHDRRLGAWLRQAFKASGRDDVRVSIELDVLAFTSGDKFNKTRTSHKDWDLVYSL